MDKEILIKLYLEEKYSIKDVAYITGKSKTTVLKYLQLYDIPTRDNLESHHTDEWKERHSGKGFKFESGNQYSSKFKFARYQEIKNIISIPFCCMCGDDESKLVVHHLDFDRNNNELDNLIILCNSCHRKEHRYYEKFPEGKAIY